MTTGTLAAPMVARAISIQQPWAWLIVHGWKDVENRTRRARYRGPLLIHAGKKFDHEAVRWVREQFPEITLPSAFERGGIVGRVEVVDCVRVSSSRWFTGPFGLVLAQREPLPFYPCRGQLGLFRIAYPGEAVRG
jgi:hypothetical protein